MTAKEAKEIRIVVDTDILIESDSVDITTLIDLLKAYRQKGATHVEIYSHDDIGNWLEVYYKRMETEPEIEARIELAKKRKEKLFEWRMRYAK